MSDAEGTTDAHRAPPRVCVLGVYLTIQSITRVVEEVLVERFEIVCKTQDLKTVAITYRPDL